MLIIIIIIIIIITIIIINGYKYNSAMYSLKSDVKPSDKYSLFQQNFHSALL